MKVGQQGFTLLELMIVVAIIAILSSIALPYFKDQLEKGRRAEGRAALLTVAQAQARYYTVHGKFASALTSLPEIDLTDIDRPTGKTSNGYFVVSTASIDGGVTFTATATTAGNQTGDDDRCAQFSINNKGEKKAHNSSGTDTRDWCWRR